MNIVSGSAPDYTMIVDGQRLQPVVSDNERAWCAAEEQYIDGVAGYFPFICPVVGARHTQFPDPVTRRRIRAALRNRR